MIGAPERMVDMLPDGSVQWGVYEVGDGILYAGEEGLKMLAATGVLQFLESGLSLRRFPGELVKHGKSGSYGNVMELGGFAFKVAFPYDHRFSDVPEAALMQARVDTALSYGMNQAKAAGENWCAPTYYFMWANDSRMLSGMTLFRGYTDGSISSVGAPCDIDIYDATDSALGHFGISCGETHFDAEPRNVMVLDPGQVGPTYARIDVNPLLGIRGKFDG